MGTSELNDQVSSPEANAGGSAAQDAASQPQAHRRISRRRLIFVDALIALTTVLLVVGVFSVWANRLLFNPDNWSNTSTQLLQNPDIRSATSNYLVDQLYSNVNVTALIRSGLPPRLQPLAAPAAGALRNVAVQGVDRALARPRVQDLWAQANRAADQVFIAIVNGGKGAVGVNNGAVTLNLGPTLANVAARLGLPADLSAKIPPNAASLTVFKANQLTFIQKAGNAIKGLALWLTILAPLLYALAVWLARGHRRRTLMTIGWSAALAGVVVLLGRSILESQLASSITTDASLHPAITATVAIATSMLSDIASGCILVGLALVLSGWFAGPARAATSGRLAIAPFLRERPVESYAIALAVMVLIFIIDPIPATGTPAGIIVLTLLAVFGMFVLRRQTMTEFPDAQLGAATSGLRARVSTMREHRQHSKATAPTASATLGDQLRQLTDLRDDGTLSSDEYEAAKTTLLHSAP